MKICPKCQNANLADASSELGHESDEIEWKKCFACGWRGRPIMGRSTVTEEELEEGEDAGEETTTMQAPGKRHCHAPGRKHRWCSVWPVKGEDYCKKHLDMKGDGLIEQPEQPAQVVASRDQVVMGDLVPATDLDHAIGQLQGDLAVLERAREIMARMSCAN